MNKNKLIERRDLLNENYQPNDFKLLIDNLRDPVENEAMERLNGSIAIGIIHGDLHGYNIFVDKHLETWLIDFATTCQGPVAQDFASFETFLRINLLDEIEWETLKEWEMLLFGSDFIDDISLSSILIGNQEIEKVHSLVMIVRGLALNNEAKIKEDEYLAALFFNALKVMSIIRLTKKQRLQAYFSAALIVNRLFPNLSK